MQHLWIKTNHQCARWGGGHSVREREGGAATAATDQQ